MSAGFAYVTGDTEHTAIPLDGSYLREADGKPASLTNGADYPVTAECRVCHGRIRLGHLMQWEWLHAPAVTVAARGGEAA